MAKSKIFIEPRAGGGFAAAHEGGKRAVVVADTQKAVIEETTANTRMPKCMSHASATSVPDRTSSERFDRLAS